MNKGKKQLIIKNYKKIQNYASKSVGIVKLQSEIKVLFLNIPSFELAWIFFSIIFSIFLLLKLVEGKKNRHLSTLTNMLLIT
ncbi:unnamed protein product [Candidatus Protochlamydia amoebophila UWE25]|uniref:Uncharacterized protein n=1 Tax=Protochlamydia amoebophila (strain UWE25) TaxID=264201 RepID=Q6MA98_PARUW|nr:unnamed protein product [Candidatus Protochlamydia amoebophila UWE25]